MEHYTEFCAFIEKALNGLNVENCGNACNIGFVDAEDQIAVNIVYASSISVINDGEIPAASDSMSDIIKVRECLKPRLFSQKFKLEALDFVRFTDSARDNRWQLRFRRY